MKSTPSTVDEWRLAVPLICYKAWAWAELIQYAPNRFIDECIHELIWMQIEWAGTAIPFADILAVTPPCVLLSFEVVNSGPTVFSLECQVSDGATLCWRINSITCRRRSFLYVESNNHFPTLVQAVPNALYSCY